ncbi:MAG: N-acetyltransferase [Gammaproteobacteria bacterium]
MTALARQRAAPASAELAADGIRPARLADIAGLHALLAHFSSRGVLLPRSEADLTRNLREFSVLELNGAIIACAALQIFTRDLGEVRSLAVAPQHARRGLGRRLVMRLEREAAGFGLGRLIALTYEAGFFHHLGFRTVAMQTLPEKLWGVCINCPKFRNCDEIAVLKTLPGAPRARTY